MHKIHKLYLIPLKTTKLTTYFNNKNKNEHILILRWLILEEQFHIIISDCPDY